MKLTVFALLICSVAVCTLANSDYDYEEDVAMAPASPPPGLPSSPASLPAKEVTLVPTLPKSNKLGGLLSMRARGTGPLASRKSPVAVSQIPVTAKTTTTELPVDQYDQYDEVEEKQNVSMTTTTEPVKKIGRGGVVRPFRSNEDLLAALKRRRAQGITLSHPRESTIQATTEIVSTKSKSHSGIGKSKTSNINEVPKSTSRVRFGGNRGKNSTFNQEEAQESKSENVQLKPKSFRRG